MEQEAFDPYRELGLPRTASTAQIKAARRKIAAKAHPDRQGADHDRMARANRAVTILADPVRRAYYDGTGNSAPPETDEQLACKLVLAAFNQLLEESLKSAVPLNIPARLVKGIKDGIRDLPKKLTEGEGILVALESYLEEVTTDEAENKFLGVLQGQIDGVNKQLDSVREQLRLAPLALEIAQRYRSSVVELPQGSSAWYHENGKGPRMGRYSVKNRKKR